MRGAGILLIQPHREERHMDTVSNGYAALILTADEGGETEENRSTATADDDS